MTPLNLTVTITQEVFDFMMIEVNHADISSRFNYSIAGADNSPIRKGNFNGQMVQLRLSHVPEGNYQFSFFCNDALIATIPFEKKSAAFDSIQMITK